MDLRYLSIPNLVQSKIVEYLQIHPDLLEEWRLEHKHKFEFLLGISIRKFSIIIGGLSSDIPHVRGFYVFYVLSQKHILKLLHDIIKKPVGRYLIPSNRDISFNPFTIR